MFQVLRRSSAQPLLWNAAEPHEPPHDVSHVVEAGVAPSLSAEIAGSALLGALELASAVVSSETVLKFARAAVSQLSLAVDRHASEMALGASEARIAGIIALASDAVVSVDEDRRITLVNHGAVTLFGYSRDELLGQPLDTLIPERLRGLHDAHIRNFADTAGSARRMGERRAVFGTRKNGQEFLAEAAISRRTVAGRVMLTAVMRDVSETRRAEQEQRFLAEAGRVLSSGLDYAETMRSVARLSVRSIADCATIDTLDARGSVQRADVAMAVGSRGVLAESIRHADLGFSVVRTAFTTRSPRLITERVPAWLTDSAGSAEQHAVVLELNPTSMMVVPILSRQRVLAVVSFYTTDARAQFTERDLDFAGHFALCAGAAIDNAQLYQQARDATRDREDLMSVVSHDLRTPLSNILLGVGMLAQSVYRDDPAVAQSLISRMERGVLRMQTLIGNLLNTASLEAGRLSVAPVALDVATLVGDAVEAQRALAGSKSIALEHDVAVDCPPICGDELRLQQVFSNLLGNAIKFTGHSGRVRVGAQEASGGVTFSVIDDGVGIPPSELPHIFDRFWQEASTAKLGNGLGLFIAKGIVESLGGTIWAESQQGVGTSLFFTLPRSPCNG